MIDLTTNRPAMASTVAVFGGSSTAAEATSIVI
jgi:hypothetical protein